MTVPQAIFRSDVLDTLAACTSFLVADMDTGEILWASRQLEIMFGYVTLGELLGKNVDVLVPLGKRSAHAQHRADFAAQLARRAVGIGLCAQGVHVDGHVFDVAVGLSGAVISGRRCILATVLQLARGTP